jgi:hypothetical protein
MILKHMSFIKVLIVITIIIGLTSPGHAGWIEVEKDGNKVLISKGRIKSTWDEGIWLINDINTNEMILVNDKLRLYSRGTIDDFCQAMSEVYTEVMKKIPPEQRALMEQEMKRQKKKTSPKVSIERMGKGGMIAGFSTMKYLVTVNGVPYREVWLTTDASLMKELNPKKMSQFIAKLKQCMVGTAGMVVEAVEVSPEYIKLEQKGIILKEVNKEEGYVETEVIRLEKKSIPDSEFQPPAGYKKISFFEMWKTQMDQGE